MPVEVREVWKRDYKSATTRRITSYKLMMSTCHDIVLRFGGLSKFLISCFIDVEGATAVTVSLSAMLAGFIKREHSHSAVMDWQ